MALTEFQQFFELLSQSKKTLIITNQNGHGDAIAGSLAMEKFLRALGHESTIVCHGFKPAPALKFLPQDIIRRALDNGREFAISVDLSECGLKNFRYDVNAGKLNLYLTPERSAFKGQDMSIVRPSHAFDLIIAIGAPDLSGLGAAYLDNPELFHETAKVNLDCSPINERFGNINLVNVASSSCSEIIYELISAYDDYLIDPQTATLLLYGVIAATGNFKAPAVTPRTLNLAGALISRGAARDQIIRELYQSRFLSTLKLWGRVLSRLNAHYGDRIISSALTAADFLETAAEPEELPDVVEELIASMPKTEIIILLREKSSGEVCGDIFSLKNHDALFLAARFNPQGDSRRAGICLKGRGLPEAEAEVIAEIKNQLAGS